MAKKLDIGSLDPKLGQIDLSNLDLSLANNITCDKCGGEHFIQAARLKHLSPVISPTGKNLNVNLIVWVCVHCKTEKELPK